MRRLAWAGFGFSAAIFASHYLLPLPWLWYASAAALALNLTAVALRGINRRRALLFFTALAVGFGWYAAYAQRVLTPLSALDGKTEQTCHARVKSYPTPGKYSDSILLHLYDPQPGRLSARVYAYESELDALVPGDEITVTLRLRSAAVRYGEETDSYLARGIGAIGSVASVPEKTGVWKYAALCFPQRLSHRLQEAAKAVFPADVFSFAQALMLGEKGPLYQENLDIPLRDAGIMHAVAVSGLHLSFLIGAVQLLFGRRRFWSMLSLPLIGVFALMAGATPSVLRAAFMGALVLLAPAFERENDPITSLLAALSVMLLCQPFSAGSASLQLSFASMAGVLLLSPPIYRALCGKCSPTREPGRGLQTVFATLAATLGSMATTMPLGAIRFGTVSLAAPITNVLVAWLLPFAFLGSFAAAAVGCVSLSLGSVLAKIVAWPLRYVLGVARLCAAVPCLRHAAAQPLTVLWLCAVYLLALILWLRRRAGKRVRLAVPICACILALVLSGALAKWIGERTPRVTALDVGQGQCLVFCSGGTDVIVDCGGSRSVKNAGDAAAAALLKERRTTLDALVLTHPHEDHVNGAERLLLQTKVGMLILPAAADADSEPLRSILETAAMRGTEIVRLSEDAALDLGDLHLDFFVDPGRDQEDGCLLLRVSRGDFDTLVTGDVTTAVEDELVSAHDLSGTELLIAGHHGSRHATGDALLDAAGAEAAIISVGDNSYGHPTPETLERLTNHGIRIYRTDELGNVTIRME